VRKRTTVIFVPNVKGRRRLAKIFMMTTGLFWRAQKAQKSLRAIEVRTSFLSDMLQWHFLKAIAGCLF
jgi:hypothetical protein